jgi:hypothetical protein
MTRDGRRLSAAAVQRLTTEAEPWLSCDDCFDQVDTFIELVLSGATALPAAMQAHLRGCSACEEEARSLLLLAAEERGVDAARALARLTAG